ncbi:MAG TPA: TonB-dependent receptor, partial [Flavisolibacter sp.]
MRQVIFFFLTIFGASLMGFGQEKNGRISGRIIDGNAKTLEAATISLMRSSDSVVVKFAVANRSGDFVFETVPFGNYMVGVTAVGHQKGYSEAFELNTGKTSIELKTIELVPVSKSMAAIVVTGKKPLIEHRIDRTVVNVDASVTNVGSSALEVLEKSPGITVDKDGNISLKGKDGVMVLIDGRPTQLAGGDLANLLRNLNANQLDQVEIMTNPPAKYDAAGNAGIINIKTKKNRQVGYNGSVTLGYGQGVYPKFNEGFVFNYREGKMNLFTNLSHNYRKSFNNLDIQRNLRNRNTKELEQYFDQEARMMNTFNSFNGKLGADYFATKNTTFGIVFSGFSNPGTFRNANQTQISDASGSLESTTIASVENKQHWKNFSTNLNFRTILDSAGRELTAD